MPTSISLLIGAGFSAPMGYPIGNRLNDLLLKESGNQFSFHSSGVLAVRKDGKKPDWGYKTGYDISYEFCKELIQLFNKKKGYFDYEEFYDFIMDEAHKDAEVKEAAKPFLGQFGSVEQLIFSLKNIYNQLVSFYINDKNNKKWYDDEAYVLKPIFPGYTGFLNTFTSLGKKVDSVNIHTLNHDLFFERLNNTEWFEGNICDGFEELGSPYYGELSVEGRSYNCRLARYTEVYNNKYKLFKLHGSFDYGVYYKSNGAMMTPETYIKTRYGVGFGEFFKEINDGKGNVAYESCWVNYHADFLTGTSSKIERYKEPLIFKKLFEKFRNNLKEADILLIIGYGCKDSEVNKMVFENFDFKKKRCFIVDPYAGDNVKKFAEVINGKLIEKLPEDLSLEDFS